MLDSIKEPSDGSREFDLNLADLINQIMAYLCRKSDKNRERLGEIMGGKVLELASDRLRAEGLIEGETRGKVAAMAGLVKDGTIDIKVAAEKMGVSVSKFKEMAAKQSFIL